LAPTNELNHGEDAAALYTAGPAPEKLLRELQQQLSRLFSAKPSEKFPLMMGTYIKYFCMNTITLTCSDFPSQMRQRIQDQFLWYGFLNGWTILTNTDSVTSLAMIQLASFSMI
jgi:hypothetical protein